MPVQMTIFKDQLGRLSLLNVFDDQYLKKFLMIIFGDQTQVWHLQVLSDTKTFNYSFYIVIERLSGY